MSFMEKPNYLGDLCSKSNSELKNLLRKQQDLVKLSKTFIKSLPDKGRKIEILIDRINEELNSRSAKLDSASDCLSRMTLKDSNEVNDDTEMIGQIINTGQTEKVYLNSYDRVIHRVQKEGGDGVSNRPKYYAHRTLVSHVPVPKPADPNKNSTDTNEKIVIDKLELVPGSLDVISQTESKSKETREETCSDSSVLGQMLENSTEASATIDQSGSTCVVLSSANQKSGFPCAVSSSANQKSDSCCEVSTNQKSLDSGEPKKVFSTAFGRRIVHGYDDSLVDVKPNRMKTRLIDFEESFALINAQLLKQNPNLAHEQSKLTTYDKYRETQQVFREELDEKDEAADDDDDYDSNKEIDDS